VKALAIDRSVEQAGCVDAVVAQGGEERRSLPLALRDLVDEARSLRRPAARELGRLTDTVEGFLVPQILNCFRGSSGLHIFATTRAGSVCMSQGRLLRREWSAHRDRPARRE
jgi:hypothetical protein